jgi:calcineurin-like phosphoesterase
VTTEDALGRFLLQIPRRFTLAKKDVKFSGVLVKVDPDTGKAIHIERLKIDIPTPEDDEEESGRL